MEVHPDTGCRLVTCAVPLWAVARDLALDAAPFFHGIRVQAWDVALTEGGPMLIELNLVGDVNLPQHAFDKGVYDGAFAALDRRP